MSKREERLEQQVRSVRHAHETAGKKGEVVVSLYAEDFDFLYAKNLIETTSTNEGYFAGAKVRRWEHKQSPKL